MRRAIIVAVSGAVILTTLTVAATGVWLPRFTAQQVTDSYQALLTQVETSGLWIRHREFHSDQDGADAVVRLALPAMWLSPRWRSYELEITTHWDYGWRWRQHHWQQWPPPLWQARSHWRIRGAGRELPALQLALRSDWRGALTGTLQSPFVTYNGQALTVRMTDARGAWQSATPNRAGEAWIELAELFATTPAQQGVWLRQLRLQARWAAEVALQLTVQGLATAGLGGVSALQLSQLTAQMETALVPVSDVTATGSLTAPALTPPTAPPAAPALTRAITLALATDTVTLPGGTYHPVAVRGSVSGVTFPPPITTLLQAPLLPTAGVSWERTALWQWLTAGEMQLQLGPLTVGSVYGDVSANAALKLRSAPVAPAPAEWWQRLTGNGRVTLPPPLVQVWLETWQRQRVLTALALQGEATDSLPPTLEQELAAAARAALTGLITDGWLLPSNAGLTATITLDQGQMRVNYRRVQALNPAAVLPLQSPFSAVTP